MKEKNIINNSTWAFNLDQINSYAFWEDFLSKDECKEIIKIVKNKKSIEGKTRGNVKNIRKSNITTYVFSFCNEKYLCISFINISIYCNLILMISN